ncbi:hypothetical protein C8Q78DRAFT_1082397 [Trametes maxima]|nr:hypothetical protein C8Q78DRAFT_1082397 [Trametes maxima]
MSSAPAPSSTGDDDGNSFLTSGSSALILAFLAIGLFVGGLLVMFAMRRYVVHGRRRAGAWRGEGTGPWDWAMPDTPPIGMGMIHRQPGMGARPVLFDVHIMQAEGEKWEDIMPISAKAEREEDRSNASRLDLAQESSQGQPDETHASNPSPSTGFLRPFTAGVHDFISNIRPFRRNPRRPESPPLSSALPPPPPSTLSAPTDGAPMPQRSAVPSCLRVALAIAMPMQQKCESGVPLCALGIADVRWVGGPLEDLRPEVASNAVT